MDNITYKSILEKEDKYGNSNKATLSHINLKVDDLGNVILSNYSPVCSSIVNANSLKYKNV
jgi:hypothetical protein